MNEFDRLEKEARAAFAGRSDLTLRVDRPKAADGLHFLSLVREDGFAVEIEWHRHRGFGIVAGRELVFGSGVDEVYATMDAAFARLLHLIETGQSTSDADAVELGELRKLYGLLQKDVAERMGISKSGLAQMERPASLATMQIETLRRLVASLGGELVLNARFPEGRERRIAVD
jgi:DNA-binding XRE family transcriptional regulator